VFAGNNRFLDSARNDGIRSKCGEYGLSWQITPTRLYELTRDPNRAKATAATNAMLQMGKIDIAALEAAFASA
jgi:predicted 3-demethylubiquinone-9 3-methyltransferase (glyoxalase superfamily)